MCRLLKALGENGELRMKWTVAGKIFAVFAALACAILLIAAVSVTSIARLNDNNRLVSHTYIVIGATNEILNSVAEADSTARTFLTTGAGPLLSQFEQQIA